MSWIDWFGDVPQHWEVMPLRFLTSVSGGATPDTQNVEYWSGSIPWVSPKDMKREFIDDAADHVSAAALSNSALKMIEPGAILIVVRGMILAHSFPTAINTVPVTINQDMKALSCSAKIESTFLVNVLKAAKDHIVTLADSSAHGTKKLETDLLGRLRIPVPPIGEQRRITYLVDRETADIDALIAAKQLLLDLLAEKRRAIVAKAIMQGLNTVALLRPSGVDWLGDIPAHWEALDLKRVVASISSGVSVNAADRPVIGTEPGVLKTSAAIGGRFLPAENKAVWETEYERLACPVKAESIIVSRMNTPALVAESGYVDKDYPNLFLPDRLWQVEIDKNLAVPKFIAQVLSSHIVRSSLSEMATGTSASMKNLSQEELLNFSIPLPPLGEQYEIVRHIATETAKIDRLRAASEYSITLLKERRGALIAAAVTGQLDIPEAA